MKEILMRTASDSGTVVYGVNAAGLMIGRKVPDYGEANRLGWSQTDEEPSRKLNTHIGRSEPSGGSGVQMEGWSLLSVEKEYWDRCTDEFTLSPEGGERVVGIVRRIRKQMRG